MPVHVRPTDLPAPDDLARMLGSRLPAFQDIAWTASTGSTNADLLARARTGAGVGKPWLLGTHLQETGAAAPAVPGRIAWARR